MPTIIGFSGAAGSGKDTAAGILIREQGYKKLSFAGVLKDAVAAVFSWPRPMLEGDTEESRRWREEPDEWWSKRLGRTITPRLVLQEWGTDLCRNHFHPDIWIAAVEKVLANAGPDDKYVITDCRFPNEVAAIKELGGKLISIRRPLPGTIKSTHASESLYDILKYDAIIDNDGSLDAFRVKVVDVAAARI